MLCRPLQSSCVCGRVPDLAGPRTYTLEELQRGYLAAVGKRRMRLPIHAPGKPGMAYRSGANLAVGAATGSLTWEQFLIAQTSATTVGQPGAA
jgi:hypothetical protein